jgi:hypothetical protein
LDHQKTRDFTREYSAEDSRVYRSAVGERVLMSILGGLLLAVGALMVLLPREHDPVLGVVALLIVLPGLVIVLFPWYSKIILFRDRVVKQELFFTRILNVRDISGYRIRTVKGSSYIDLIPSAAGARKITFTKNYLKDAHFTQWLAQFPNLDEIERREVEAEIEQDAALGATPEERKRSVARFRKIAAGLAMVYLAGPMYSVIYPHPLWLAIALIVSGPFVAIGMVFIWNRGYTIIELDKKVMLRKGGLIVLFFMPALALLMALLDPLNPLIPGPRLNGGSFFTWSLLGAALVTALVARVSPDASRNRKGLLIVFATMTVNAWGTLAIANELFDHAEAGTFQLQVVDKHKQTGKHTSYWLAVRNVSGRAYDGVTSVKVAYPVFNQLNPGDLYCAQIHPGALGVRWESFGDC